ncbi:MAG: glycosyltransferase family 4 protein [Candidatus Nanohaloarchaea archaeon]
MDKKVLSIYYDECHSVHRDFYQEVGDIVGFHIDADPGPTNVFRYLKRGFQIPADYDAYLMGGVALRSGLVRKYFGGFDGKIIRMLASQEYYEAAKGEKDDKELRFKSRYIDGLLSVSPMMAEYAQQYLDVPTEVVRPFVPEHQKFSEVEYDCEENNILFVGANYYNKNVDSLIKAVESVNKSREEKLKLHLVGKGHEQHESDNIVTHGYVEDLSPLFKKAKFYVQPSKGDAYPVSTLEAMLTKTPTIVTEGVGTKDIVKEVNSDWVTGTKPEELAEALMDNLDMDKEDHKEFAEQLHQKAREFTPENQKEKFSNAIERLANA